MTRTATLFALVILSAPTWAQQPQLGYEVRQLTFGPAHHFYGYIGHVGNSPYSADGRHLVALRTTFQDRMPRPDDAADIVLLDAGKNYAETKVEETRGWNPQQGAMMYWNPAQPSRQFFFNDRDPKTGKVFTALYDIIDRKRVKEFRFEQTPAANGGVKQDGGAFAAINYARMARLRPVTGYPGAWDWTEGVTHPQDDGLFVVDVKTGARKLIVSFRQMRDALIGKHPEIDDRALFLNHTLWNREGDRIFFFVRADFNDPKRRVNIPMTVRPDGSELVEQRIFIGGHPEWDFNSRMIGRVEDKLVLYDTLAQQIVETIGGPEMFRDPEGDTALSRDGKWIVNGAPTGATMHYTILRRSDRVFFKTEDFSRGTYTGGDLRIDPAPCWNREGDRFAFPALAKDGTRQMFEVRVTERTKVAASAGAQSSGVYVNREKVDAALAKGDVLIDGPQVHIAGGHRAKPGALQPQKGTTILYVTDGEGTFAAGERAQRMTRGDVIVIPAGTRQSFTSVSPSISYVLVTVPVLAANAKAEVVYVGHDKVAATMKKAGPLADGPNLRVSGGYRTGPYAPADYRPDVEIHTKEADLFYVIDGRATQVLGGSVIGGKETGPGQIRGSKIEGGQTYHVGQGDVVWVPAGVPHWFPEIPEPLSYLLVKVFY